MCNMEMIILTQFSLQFSLLHFIVRIKDIKMVDLRRLKIGAAILCQSLKHKSQKITLSRLRFKDFSLVNSN